MLKNYRWNNGEMGGRVAVRFELGDVKFPGHMELRVLSGAAPPAEFVGWWLGNEAGVKECAAEQHAARRDVWGLDVRKGMSGCMDISVARLVDESWGDVERGPRVHISMLGKLNQNIPPIQLRDLLVIETQILGRYKTFECEEARIFVPEGGWNNPGAPIPPRRCKVGCSEILLSEDEVRYENFVVKIGEETQIEGQLAVLIRENEDKIRGEFAKIGLTIEVTGDYYSVVVLIERV